MNYGSAAGERQSETWWPVRVGAMHWQASGAGGAVKPCTVAVCSVRACGGCWRGVCRGEGATVWDEHKGNGCALSRASAFFWLGDDSARL